MRKVTVCLLVEDGKVLLAQKNGGRGHGHWGGYGGKFEDGESPEQAGCREMWEESCIAIREHELEKYAEISIHKTRNNREFEIHVYIVKRWTGVATDTKEMHNATWFSFENLPLQKMWSADRVWMPLILAGRKFRASFNANATAELLSYEEVQTFD